MGATPPKDADKSDVSMRCIECGYLLENLQSSQCPECGRPFDRDDPLTFDSWQQRYARAYALTAWGVAIWGISLLGYCATIAFSGSTLLELNAAMFTCSAIAIAMYLVACFYMGRAAWLVRGWGYAFAIATVALLFTCLFISGPLVAAAVLRDHVRRWQRQNRT